MRPRALDANVILRFLTADHPEQSPRCRELFRRVQEGEEVVFLPEAALADVVWTLKSFYRWPVDRLGTFIGSLLALDGVEMQRKQMVWEALSVFRRKGIDFSDAMIAAEMAVSGLEELYSYDRDFDRLTDVRRVEPNS